MRQGEAQQTWRTVSCSVAQGDGRAGDEASTGWFLPDGRRNLSGVSQVAAAPEPPAEHATASCTHAGVDAWLQFAGAPSRTCRKPAAGLGLLEACGVHC